MRGLAPALFLLCALDAGAGQVNRAEVSHDKGSYHMLLDVDLDADLAPAYAIATDFDNLERISPTVIEASRLPDPAPGLQRRKMVMRTCILFFCFNADFVENAEIAGHTIVTILCDSGTRYTSKLFNPDFLLSKNLPVPDWLDRT